MAKYKKYYNDPDKTAGKKKALKKRIKTVVIVLIAVILAAAIGFTVYFIVKNAVNRVKPIGRTDEQAMVIGHATHEKATYDVYYDELRAITCFYKISIGKLAGCKTNEEAMAVWDNPNFVNEHREELESHVKANLINNYVNFVFCDYFGVDPESDEVDDYVQDQIETWVDEVCDGSMSEYREWLESEHLTDAYFRFSLRSSYLESVVYYSLVESGFFEFTQDRSEDFIAYVLDKDANNYCTAYSILVEDKADAEMILGQINAAESAGERLMKITSYIGSSYNKDYGLSTGNMYCFTHGEMSKAYEDTAFALNVGEAGMSEETEDGYYIILRIETEERYVKANWIDLLKGYQSAAMGVYTDGIADNMKFEFNEDGGRIDLTTVK